MYSLRKTCEITVVKIVVSEVSVFISDTGRNSRHAY